MERWCPSEVRHYGLLRPYSTGKRAPVLGRLGTSRRRLVPPVQQALTTATVNSEKRKRKKIGKNEGDFRISREKGAHVRTVRAHASRTRRKALAHARCPSLTDAHVRTGAEMRAARTSHTRSIGKTARTHEPRPLRLGSPSQGSKPRHTRAPEYDVRPPLRGGVARGSRVVRTLSEGDSGGQASFREGGAETARTGKSLRRRRPTP